MDDAFAERVRARCEAEGITVSTLVHELVAEWLDDKRPAYALEETYERARKLALYAIEISTPRSYAEAMRLFTPPK